MNAKQISDYIEKTEEAYRRCILTDPECHAFAMLKYDKVPLETILKATVAHLVARKEMMANAMIAARERQPATVIISQEYA